MMSSSVHTLRTASSLISTAPIRLQDIPVLCEPHCKIKDPQRVEKIINELAIGGPARLQLVTDFDFTITKQRTTDGNLIPSSFGIFESCNSLPKEYIEQAQKLTNHYRPIEIDPHIPKDEKIKHMVEWWTKSGALLHGFPFDKTEIDGIAAKYKYALRDYSNALFNNLYKLNVPVLVFSAGLGDCVVAMLKHSNVFLPNVKVISNFLQYKDGLLNGFKKPLIHAFNKNETVLQGNEYYDLVHNRDHIIVMGDSLGDASMADGVPVSSHIIKIGFLYHHVEDSLEKYMNAFDIVLVDDQTMNVPRALVNIIENSNQDHLVYNESLKN